METSGNPRSFKMDRMSPQASQLKETISKKLFEFLGNYTDDVLAEYIVVLVCNGKHQNQAKDDLDAFLGEESGEFVAWLWEHLLQNYSPSKTPSSLSNTQDISDTSDHDHDVDKNQRASRSKHLQNHTTRTSDSSRSKDGKQSVQPTFSNEPINSNTTEGFQHWCPGVDAPLSKSNSEDVRTQICRSEIQEKGTESNNNEAVKYGDSRERCSTIIADASGECLQYHDQYKKIVISNNNESSHQFLHSSKNKEVMRNLQLVVTENANSRPPSTSNAARLRVPSRAMDTAASHINHRPRGNVWDRLGKPCEDNNVMMEDKSYPHGFDIMKKRKIEYDGEGLEGHRLMLVVPDRRFNRGLMGEAAVLDNISSKVIPNTHANDYGKQGQGVNAVLKLSDAGNSGQKRQLIETDSGNSLGSLSGYMARGGKDKKVSQGLERSLSSKYDDSQGLNGITSSASRSDSPTSATISKPVKFSRAGLKPVAHKLSQEQPSRKVSLSASTQTPVSVCSSLLAKLDSPHNAENGSANHKLMKDEVLDVKLKLRQIEMEMSKLRSKQVEMNSDSIIHSSLCSGAQNNFEDDIESRTVSVTNVHFAATKEALSSHFSKCGVVIRTILLTDPVTTQPKGAAYVSFASKESADKAIALDGTSFFSRTLKVMRKADMPAALSVPTQLPAKPLQPWHSSQSHKKGHLQRQYSSSHLQWRRDNPANTGNSPTAHAGRLDASKAAEQEVGDSGRLQFPRPLTYVRMEARSATETPSVS